MIIFRAANSFNIIKLLGYSLFDYSFAARSAIFSPCPAMGALLLSGLPQLRLGLFRTQRQADLSSRFAGATRSERTISS